jgi:hypothetical protein
MSGKPPDLPPPTFKPLCRHADSFAHEFGTQDSTQQISDGEDEAISEHCDEMDSVCSFSPSSVQQTPNNIILSGRNVDNDEFDTQILST